MNHRFNVSGIGFSVQGGILGSLLFSLVVIGMGGGMIYYIYSSEPEASRTTVTRQSAMPVEVTGAEHGTFRPTIEVQGTVRPAKEITLRPRVEGKVIDRSENFTPGGYTEKGEVLVRLDPSDYKYALRQRKSELQQNLRDLKLEMGRQDIAQQEYDILQENLLDDSLSEDEQSLVFRKPQLKAAKAQVDSARAAVQHAEKELARTRIKAPFDGLITNRNVNMGSQVSAGDQLARIVGTHKYWVEAQVPLSKLQWITFSKPSDSTGAAVRIRNRTAWAKNQFRTGYLDRSTGEVNEQTRMARVLVAVHDPLARDRESRDRPALMIGSFVQAQIQGMQISDVVKLSRDLVHENDTVWVYSNGKLDIRNVEITYRDEQFAYIKDGLKKGEQVVTTPITTVSDGVKLSIKGKDSETENHTEAAGN